MVNDHGDWFYVALAFACFVAAGALLAWVFRPARRPRTRPRLEALSDGAGAAQFADQEHTERMRAAGRR